MIIRVLVALAGAAIITSIMLLVMSEFTTMFRERNNERYFLITDIIPRPDRGRPQRPPAAKLPPERTAPELEQRGLEITVESVVEPSGDFAIENLPALPNLEELTLQAEKDDEELLR